MDDIQMKTEGLSHEHVAILLIKKKQDPSVGHNQSHNVDCCVLMMVQMTRSGRDLPEWNESSYVW
jgi:hypothetical protein